MVVIDDKLAFVGGALRETLAKPDGPDLAIVAPRKPSG
jgi:hypothetical protein